MPLDKGTVVRVIKAPHDRPDLLGREGVIDEYIDEEYGLDEPDEDGYVEASDPFYVVEFDDDEDCFAPDEIEVV